MYQFNYTKALTSCIVSENFYEVGERIMREINQYTHIDRHTGRERERWREVRERERKREGSHHILGYSAFCSPTRRASSTSHRLTSTPPSSCRTAGEKLYNETRIRVPDAYVRPGRNDRVQRS